LIFKRIYLSTSRSSEWTENCRLFKFLSDKQRYVSSA